MIECFFSDGCRYPDRCKRADRCRRKDEIHQQLKEGVVGYDGRPGRAARRPMTPKRENTD